MTDPNFPPPDASPAPQAAPESLAPSQDARETEAPQPAIPAIVVPVAASHEHRGALPVLSALGFVLLVAGLAWTWNQQQVLRQQVTEQAVAAALDPAHLAALQNDIATLRQRLQRLEQRPAVPAVDLSTLESRLSALEQRPAAPAADVGALESRLKAMEQRLTQSEQAETSVAARAGRIARLQATAAALEAGQPLGELPGAPAALTRFATASPPTAAALRLSFPAAAERAEAASRPSTQGQSLAQRMWQRAQSLITVRQGDKVVIGAPAAIVLASARERLEAGDLAGAVAALGQLDGPAAQAIADWREQAQTLLDARAALAQMVHN